MSNYWQQTSFDYLQLGMTVFIHDVCLINFSLHLKLFQSFIKAVDMWQTDGMVHGIDVHKYFANLLQLLPETNRRN